MRRRERDVRDPYRTGAGGHRRSQISLAAAKQMSRGGLPAFVWRILGWCLARSEI
jgi:hypothetical protein